MKIGITGGIGSGKSIVCRVLKTMGYPVFDADIAAKKIMLQDIVVKSEVIALLGEGAYIKGELNRAYIAEKIFNNDVLREQLNQIVHPAVRKSFQSWSDEQEQDYTFMEAAILFETGGDKNFDEVILVTANEETRIQRVVKRDGASRNDILKRMAKQMPESEKETKTNLVIYNEVDRLIIPQILSILKKLKYQY